jgi:hypothetical protein
MLHWVIAEYFEKAVGKGQAMKDEGKAVAEAEGIPFIGADHLGLHIGFSVWEKEDHKEENQYHSHHMFIYAPMNYVYVAVQERWVDVKGAVFTNPMDIISYHDSCWRDAISTFIWSHREDLSGFQAFELLGCFDVVEISDEQRKYLSAMENFRQNNHKKWADGERPDVLPPFHVGEDMWDYWRTRTKKIKFEVV